MIITNELLLILADDDYVFLVCVLFDSGLYIYVARRTKHGSEGRTISDRPTVLIKENNLRLASHLN